MGKGMKAGKRPKPPGAGGAGGGAGMQKQLQQMQAVQRRMDDLQGELEKMETTATSGGGAVSVTVNGRKEITGVVLKPEVVDPEDVEMLQDLILTASNEALRQMEEISQAEMAKITGSLGLPPGLMG